MNEIRYPLAATTWDDLEIAAMHEVIESGHFTMGKQVADFEESFARYFGARYAVMSNSGSSANLLALAAIKYGNTFDLEDRDEVIVPAVSWSTTYYPVSQLGFKLKFVDVDKDTLNLDVEGVRKAINPRTAGIVTVNLLGNPSDLIELKKIAVDAGIFLFEDNCESMGAKVDGKHAGTFGHLGSFSFFFSHHISTMEGGMTLTDDVRLAEAMRSLRAHGWTRELPDDNSVFKKTGEKFDDLFRFVLPGYNLRPLELSGAIGKVQLSKFAGFLDARRQNASKFKELISSFNGFRTQAENGMSSWFGFSLVLEGHLSGRRAELVRALERAGIEARPIVAGNFARNPVLHLLSHSPLPPLVVADDLHDNGIFVGNHHYSLDQELELLADTLRAFSQDNL